MEDVSIVMKAISTIDDGEDEKKPAIGDYIILLTMLASRC